MEDFVPFETAKKLKEKGFREKCFAFYYKQGGFQWNCMRADTGLVNVSWACLNYNDIVDGEKINAPTISQVLKWLREEKRWNIMVKIDKIDGWYYILQDMEGECYVTSDNDCFSSYELAALSGIKYVLDNLI